MELNVKRKLQFKSAKYVFNSTAHRVLKTSINNNNTTMKQVIKDHAKKILKHSPKKDKF